MPLDSGCPPDQDAPYPVRRILGALTADDRDPEIRDGEEQAANSLCTERARVQRVSLDQEVWPLASTPEASDLPPEAAVADRRMQIANRLALDQAPLRNPVVPGCESTFDNIKAEPAKRRWNAARTLENVSHHMH
jgi:hypothetical protein